MSVKAHNIPIHWHPDPDFAEQHLDSPFGKNEAWILIGTRPGAKAWIGWKEAIEKSEFRRLMEAQDIETLRSLMHVVEPKVGEVYFLRTPIVHSLGTGLCVLEPQEPTDWNILAEWEGFPYDKEDGHLGLGWDLAVDCAEFDKLELDYLNNYIRRTPELVREEGDNREDRNRARRSIEIFRLYTVDGQFNTQHAPPVKVSMLLLH